jgi:hypothetical protein
MRSRTHFLRYLTVISLGYAKPEDDSANESKHVAKKLTSYDNCIIVKYTVALDCTFLLFYINDWVCSNGGMILTGENRSTRRETCPNVNVSTTQPTQKAMGLKPGLCGERPTINCQTMARSKFSNHSVRLVQNTYSAVQCASRIRNFIAVTTKACHGTLIWIRSIHFYILSQSSPTCISVRNLLT